jgi:hypothetical protein
MSIFNIKMTIGAALLSTFVLLAQTGLGTWAATGQTDALDLSAVNENGFSIKNVSGKPITAFALSFRGTKQTTYTLYVDFFGMQTGSLGPGSSYGVPIR